MPLHTRETLAGKSKVDLQNICITLKIAKSGNKDELVQRILSQQETEEKYAQIRRNFFKPIQSLKIKNLFKKPSASTSPSVVPVPIPIPTSSSSIPQNAANLNERPKTLFKKVSQTFIKATNKLKGKASQRFSWNTAQQVGSSIDNAGASKKTKEDLLSSEFDELDMEDTIPVAGPSNSTLYFPQQYQCLGIKAESHYADINDIGSDQVMLTYRTLCDISLFYQKQITNS